MSTYFKAIDRFAEGEGHDTGGGVARVWQYLGHGNRRRDAVNRIDFTHVTAIACARTAQGGGRAIHD